MHDIVKTRKTVFVRQYPKLKREAKEAIKRAHSKLLIREGEERERTMSENTAEDSNINVTMATPGVPVLALKCAICHESVKLPCWYCIDCQSKKLSLSFQLDLTPRHQAICSYASNVIKKEGPNSKSIRKITR